MNLTTTFRRLRAAGACTSRYTFLRKALTGVKDDEPINLLLILKTNGLDDALWALNATAENCDKVVRLMAADFAEQVLPIWKKYYPEDKRPELAIAAARDYAHGRIPAAAWAAARAGAGDAARAAAWDAGRDAGRAAAGDAARAAARAAAWAGARAAAGDAARAGARAAARAAAWAAAWAAAGEKQKENFIRYLQEAEDGSN